MTGLLPASLLQANDHPQHRYSQGRGPKGNLFPPPCLTLVSFLKEDEAECSQLLFLRTVFILLVVTLGL
jgi:hypothetical protein